MFNNYNYNGVTADAVTKDSISLTYNGLLARSGADSVYAVCGYGNSWTDQNVIKMSRTGQGFQATIPAKDPLVNIAFKDSANNWDNNNGQNYTFNVTAAK